MINICEKYNIYLFLKPLDILGYLFIYCCNSVMLPYSKQHLQIFIDKIY